MWDNRVFVAGLEVSTRFSAYARRTLQLLQIIATRLRARGVGSCLVRVPLVEAYAKRTLLFCQSKRSLSVRAQVPPWGHSGPNGFRAYSGRTLLLLKGSWRMYSENSLAKSTFLERTPGVRSLWGLPRSKTRSCGVHEAYGGVLRAHATNRSSVGADFCKWS